jgi:hypothetical protein
MEPENRVQSRKGIWDILNSPLALVIISTAVLGGGAKLYSDHQDAIRDQSTRRSELGELLTEYQHRVSALTDADRELNKMLGSEERPKAVYHGSPAQVAQWERLAADVSRREWDVLTGRGTYTPTSPKYAAVNIQVIALQIENLAGIPEMETAAWRTFGFIDSPPPDTWLFIRSSLDVLQQFGFSRSMLYSGGDIPLLRGRSLSPDQEVWLGRDLQTLQNRSDEVHNHLQETIEKLEANQTAADRRP